jgi:hypothetical protein
VIAVDSADFSHPTTMSVWKHAHTHPYIYTHTYIQSSIGTRIDTCLCIHTFLDHQERRVARVLLQTYMNSVLNVNHFYRAMFLLMKTYFINA